MTNLETRIITHPPIPLADVTPLEMLILTNVLECSETDAGLVLFTDFGPTNPINVKRQDLIEAFRASAPHVDSALNVFIASRVIAFCPPPPARSMRRRQSRGRLREGRNPTLMLGLRFGAGKTLGINLK